MPTRRKSQVNRRRRTRRVTKRRIRGGGKEPRKTLKSVKTGSMDMSSLFNDLPSITRKRLPSVKQVAINEEKYQKALAKTIRDDKKKVKAATVKEMDDLSNLFGKL